MKRSKKLTLAVMGLTPIVLTACSEKPVDMLVYKTLNECSSDVYYNSRQCKTEFDKALRTHRSGAPMYRNAASCEGDFGKSRCENLGRFYSPRIAAYMIPMPRKQGQPYYGGIAQPLYTTRGGGGSYRTGDNYEIGKSSQRGKISTSASKARAPSVKTKTIARGGFGSQAAVRGSWGGGGKSFGG